MAVANAINENFFDAKFHACGCAQRAFRLRSDVAASATALLSPLHRMHEMRSSKRRFLHSLLVRLFGAGALIRLMTVALIGTCCELLRRLERLLVNTSLSRTLFFLVRWCIREEVHLDSRMHAATKPSHTSEGNMAKKAAKKTAKKAVKKTAKTAAKKTAKKTKKVSKKK